MTVFLITAATAAPCTAQTRQQLTHISGELGDTTVQWICIQHTEADHKINGIDTIPFCNGRFEYDLRSSSPAVFQVTAFDNKGRGKFVNFFAEGDTVRIKFHATRKAEWHSSTPLNKELLTVERNKAGIITPLLARQRQMIEDGSDLTPEGKTVKERLRLASQNGSNDSVVKAIAQDARRLAKEGGLETPEYKALDRQIESAFMETGRFQMEYSRDNPGPVGLLCLYNVTQMFDAGTGRSGNNTDIPGCVCRENARIPPGRIHGCLVRIPADTSGRTVFRLHRTRPRRQRAYCIGRDKGQICSHRPLGIMVRPMQTTVKKHDTCL